MPTCAYLRYQEVFIHTENTFSNNTTFFTKNTLNSICNQIETTIPYKYTVIKGLILKLIIQH